MSLVTASVLVHKFSDLDVKCTREILRAEGQLKEARKLSTSVHFDVTQLGLSDTVVDLLFDSAYKNGNTVLHVAFLKYGPGFIFDSVLKIYLKETTKNVANDDGLSFLHMACTRPYVPAVQALLQSSRMNVNCRVSQKSGGIFSGFSPLHFAVQYRQYEVADLLLRQNADLYILDRNNYSTPLHIALEQCNVPMIDLLLAYDRRRDNVVNMWGLSHLMVACAGNDVIAVSEYIQKVPESSRNDLINSKVDVGHKFVDYTPLRFAMEFNRSRTVQLLNDYSVVIPNTTPATMLRRRLAINRSPLSVKSYKHDNFNTNMELFITIFNILALNMFLLLVVPTLLS